MPYVFPHDDLFMWGVGLLIVALLVVRRLVVRRRAALSGDAERRSPSGRPEP